MRQQPTFYRLDRQAANGGRGDRPESGGAPSMIPLPPGWLCLQDCNLSGQLNQPVVVPFVLIHPDVGVALIDVSPAANPEAEIVLRRRLEAARFGSIFPGFLPVLHLQLDRADLPSVEAILRDAFASLPPLSVPGGDGWVSVVRRALVPRDPSRAAAHHAGLPAAGPPHAAPPLRNPPAAEQAARPRRPWRAAKAAAEDTEPDMLGRGLAARSAGDSPLPDAPEEPASRPISPLPWIIMSGVGSLIAVLALFGLLNTGADSTDEAGPPAAPVVAATPMPAPTPTLAPPAPASNPVAALPPPRPTPAPALPASSPKPPPAAAPAPPAPPPPAAAAVPPPPSAPPAASTAGAPAAPTPAQRPAAAPAAAERLPRVTVREPANLRAGPNGQADVVRVAPRGETFRVFDRTANGWLQVGDDEPRGWLHRSRLGEVVEQ